MNGLRFRNFSNVNFNGNSNQRNQKNNNVKSQFAPMQGDKVSFTSDPNKVKNAAGKVAEGLVEEVFGPEAKEALIRSLREIDKH